MFSFMGLVEYATFFKHICRSYFFYCKTNYFPFYFTDIIQINVT